MLWIFTEDHSMLL